MTAIYSDKRKSGISIIGDLPWGSHFCQFYQTKEDLLEVFVPYIKAGLENDELCVLVTSKALTHDDAEQALQKAVPSFNRYVMDGRMEIISESTCHQRMGRGDRAKGKGQDGKRKDNEVLVSLLDKVVSGGFSGLRLACSAFTDTSNGRAHPCFDERELSKYNALALFTYPRDTFDALGLMQVVKGHRFALIKNNGEWEIIESSEAHSVKEALIRSEEKLRSLFNNMSEGFAYHRIVLDEKDAPCDYVFLEINEAFERLTGLKAENIIGKRATEALPGIEKDPADWIGTYGKVAMTGEPVQFESYSGSLNKWFSVSAFSPHKGYFAVTFSDISGRRHAEERTRHLASFPEMNPNPVMETDLSGNITYCNPAIRNILEDLGMDKDNANAFLPDDFDMILLQLEKRHDSTVHREVIISDRIFSTTVHIVPQFEVIRLYSHDITERKKNEEVITQIKEEWERTFDSVPDLIAILDQEHRIVRANRAMSERLGTASDKCVGLHCFACVHGSSSPPEICPHSLTMKDGKEHSAEVYEERMGGHFLVTTTPMFDKKGNMTGTVHVARDITERKRVEREMQSLAQQRQLALDAAHLGWWQYDPITRIAEWDDGYKAIYGVNGYTRPDGIFTEIIHPDDLPALRAKVEAALNPDGPEPYMAEYRINRPDGEMRWVRAHGIAAFEGEGDQRHAVNFVGTVEDITERKQAEQRLQILSETAGELLAAERPQEIVKRLCIRVMSHLDCHTFFNFLVDEIAGRLRLNAYAGIQEEVAEEIEWLDYGVAVCGCVARDGKRIICENIPETPDERTELVKSYGIKAYACHPLIAGGKVIGTLSFGTRTRTEFRDEDINLMKTVADQVSVAMDRIRTQETLRESERRLNRSQEIARLGSWELDLTNNHLYWSDEVYRIFGLSPQEFTASYEAFIESVHPGDREAVDEAYSGSIRDGKDSYEIEHRIILRSTGEVRTVHEKCEHIRDAGGRIIRSMGMVHDITERKKMEQERERLVDDLRRSNEELEQFAYIASHDLQEPLRMISSYTSLIKGRYKGRLDNDADEFIDYITSGTTHMQSLLSDLLMYSRVGKSREPMETVNLESVLERAIGNLRTAIDDSRAAITHENLPTLFADKLQMVQVFQNLISNAIKFRRNETPRIHVSAEQGDNEWTIRVKDNGIGIDPRYYDKLFIVFKRLHSREEYPGTGIGLAICSKIVERHGGRIWVESEPGKGATFSFTVKKQPSLAAR